MSVQGWRADHQAGAAFPSHLVLLVASAASLAAGACWMGCDVVRNLFMF